MHSFKVLGWRCTIALAAVLVLIRGSQAAPAQDDALDHARNLLKSAILFDGHNDLPWAIREYKNSPGDLAAYDLRTRTPGVTDLPRLRQGRLGAQFWSVFIPAEPPIELVRAQLEQIDLARRMIARYPEALKLALTAADVRFAHREGRIASLLGIEGGHAIENSLGVLRAYYTLGVRYMTLTHNSNTAWADSANDIHNRHLGLTEFGEQVVREMNRLGMLIDLSHTADETMRAALRISRAPVIFSHSSARHLVDVPRNVPDAVLQQLRDNAGVVMVTFVPGFVNEDVAWAQQSLTEEIDRRQLAAHTDEERKAIAQQVQSQAKLPAASIADVVRHIEYIREKIGVEHVGIGSDFDGASFWPEGLSDVSMFPNLFAELIRRGWSDRDLKLLAGENVLRVMERAEVVAQGLRAR